MLSHLHLLCLYRSAVFGLSDLAFNCFVFPLLGFTVPWLLYYSMVTWKVGMGSPEALVRLPDLITRMT